MAFFQNDFVQVARGYYSPELGRFISPDRSIKDGLNRYAYCKNNPIRFIDPTGEVTQEEGRRMAEEGQKNMTVTQNSDGSTTYTTSYTDTNGQTHNVSFTTGGGQSNDSPSTAGVFPPGWGWDPTKPPGPGWEWRGKPGSKPGDSNGGWFNPDTGASLHPDLDHPEPVPPHIDWIPGKGEKPIKLDPETGEPLPGEGPVPAPQPTPLPTPQPTGGAEGSSGSSSKSQPTMNINWGDVATGAIIVVGVAVGVYVAAHAIPIIIVGAALGVFD